VARTQAAQKVAAQPGPGRPRRFQPDEVVAAALELGPEPLALRDVADALQVPRTTIYNHVRSPEALGRLVLASLIEIEHSKPWELADEQPWPELLEVFARRIRGSMLAAGLWLKYWTPEIGAPVLRYADRLIGRLVSEGFSIEAAGHALALIHAVAQDGVMRHAMQTSGPDEDKSPLDDLDDRLFPWIVPADTLSDPEREEERFDYNLACAIYGIRAALDGAETRSLKRRR
jgi:AcrR family transcriptional regulator